MSRLSLHLPLLVLELLVQSGFFCGKSLISRVCIWMPQFPEKSSLQWEKDFTTGGKKQVYYGFFYIYYEKQQSIFCRRHHLGPQLLLHSSVTISSGIGYFTICSTTEPVKCRSFLTLFHLTYFQKSYNSPGNLHHSWPSSLKHISKHWFFFCFYMALSSHELTKIHFWCDFMRSSLLTFQEKSPFS